MPAVGSELSYTYLDIGAAAVETSLEGVRMPVPGQTVSAELSDGDGLTVGGSLAIGRRFYIAAANETAVIGVDAFVASPLATAFLGGNVDRVTAHAAVGYVQPIGLDFDVVFELAYDTIEYDFGSFAGESFDVDDGGAGFGLGFRWNPQTTVELFAMAYGSEVGEIDLTSGTFDSGTRAVAGVRWYFFEDLGLGFDYRSGDADSVNVSLRFGFGDLRAGY
jgi:hypothetical protein